MGKKESQWNKEKNVERDKRGKIFGTDLNNSFLLNFFFSFTSIFKQRN